MVVFRANIFAAQKQNNLEMNNLEELELRQKIDLLLRTGKVLMESTASTNQTQLCMQQLADYMHIPQQMLHIDVRYTMLIVNISNSYSSFCKFQKIERHTVDMTAISRVVALVNSFCEKPFSLKEYSKQLDKITSAPRNFRQIVVALGAGLACGGFCRLFGGDWIAFVFTSICASIGFLLRTKLVERKLNFYFSTAIAAFVATCLAFACSVLALNFNLSPSPYHPLLACALFIVPGVPLINFVDDMIDNQLLVGLTRFANTMMIVGALTFGIAFAIKFLSRGNYQISDIIQTLSLYPGDNSYVGCALAAAIAAMGFSMIFNIERRWLPIVAAGAIVAVVTRNACNYALDLGPVVSSFLASLLASFACVRIARKLNIPNHVLSIPSVIPMIPGVLMYRSLLGFAHSSVGGNSLTDSFQCATTSALIILCISLGVAFPSIIMRMKRKNQMQMRCF